jgi:hypothetical protein
MHDKRSYRDILISNEPLTVVTAEAARFLAFASEQGQ